MVLVFRDAILEHVQFSVETVSLFVDRRACKMFIKSLLHLSRT